MDNSVLAAVYRAETATERKALSYKFVTLFANAGIEDLTGNPDKCYIGTLSYGGNDGIIVEHVQSHADDMETGYDLITIKSPLSLPIIGNRIKPASTSEINFNEISFEGWEITMTPAV